MSIHDVTFTRAELAHASPWTFEQLAEIADAEILSAIEAISGTSSKAQPIRVWVRAAERCHSDLWRAIDAQG